MLIGVSTKEPMDFSERSGFPPSEAIIYDAVLPFPVIKSLNIIRNDFGDKVSFIPTAVQSFHGHGGDYGLEFRERDFEDIDLNPSTSSGKFTTRNLVARVSFGMSPINKRVPGERGTIYRDTGVLNRLHLNVFGARQFLPENYEDIQKGKDGFSYVRERVHFSMRWIDGKFDPVWNDFSQFEEHLDSKGLNHPVFKEMRTTYMSSGQGDERINGTFVRDLAGARKEDVRENSVSLKEVYEILGSGKRILPSNLTREKALENFPESFDPKRLDSAYGDYSYSGGKKESFEHVGYRPVLGVLSDFGDVGAADDRKIVRMDMAEGVDYIFGKVLPAMRKYTLSK